MVHFVQDNPRLRLQCSHTICWFRLGRRSSPRRAETGLDAPSIGCRTRPNRSPPASHRWTDASSRWGRFATFARKTSFPVTAANRSVANCLPVRYTPEASSYFPFCQALIKSGLVDPCSVVFDQRGLAASAIPDVALGNDRSLRGRQISGAPVARSAQATAADGV